MSAIGIVQIGSSLGSVVRKNIDKYPGSVDLAYLEKTVGILQTHHKRSEQTAVDLCAEAFADLRSRHGVDCSQIDVLVVVSQHTRPNIPPLSAALSGRLQLSENVYCLDLSIGCTGFVHGLHVASTLLEALGGRNALLVNVETLSEVLAKEDANTNYIFSDAATCTLLGKENVFAFPRRYDFGTSGERCFALNATSSQLHMDGLEIYKYVTTKVPSKLKHLLAACELNSGDLDFIFFHQASLRTVSKIKESFPGVRAPYSILEYGNTASCSIPFLLQAHREEIVAGTQGWIALSSFGSGLSFANCVLQTRNA